jgi:hypothetical protein
MSRQVTIDSRLLRAVMLAVVSAVFLSVLVWGAVAVARWHCEQRLGWMGFRGTTPPYSIECHVDFENRGMVPLGQIRWRL